MQRKIPMSRSFIILIMILSFYILSESIPWCLLRRLDSGSVSREWHKALWNEYFPMTFLYYGQLSLTQRRTIWHTTSSFPLVFILNSKNQIVIISKLRRTSSQSCYLKLRVNVPPHTLHFDWELNSNHNLKVVWIRLWTIRKMHPSQSLGLQTFCSKVSTWAPRDYDRLTLTKLMGYLVFETPKNTVISRSFVVL